MSQSVAAAWVGIALGLTLSGCSAGVPASATEQPQRAEPADTFREPPSVIAEAPPIALDELPLRFPTSGRTQAADSADDVARSTKPPGLIETLRGTIGGSPVFDDAGATTPLLDSLDAAQQELLRVKRGNRRALREAGRQVRVGSANASPHLVLITVDGLAYGDLGCYGGPVRTPHIDAFAAEGLRFTSFYAASIDTRAARWSLLTGLNVGHAPPANQSNATERFCLNENRMSLANVLWQAGYATAFVGVWRDRELPLDHGADEWTGVLDHPEPGPYPEFLYVDTAKARLSANADSQRALPVVDFLIDESLASLARGVATGRPCFLHLALSPRQLAVGSDGGSLDDAASRITALDAALGRLVSRIDASELSNRCCVVIAGESTPSELSESSDDARKRAGELRLSQDGLSEGNLRVPLLVRWPGHTSAGATTDLACAAWDVLPTFAELAAAQRKPLQSDGLSFVAELTGGPQKQHAMMYWEMKEPRLGQAVRKGRWKAVRAPGESSVALYDLHADPREQNDVADQHPDIVQQFIVRRR